MYQEIEYEVNEPIATVRFNRPDRLNAATYRLLGETRHALGEAERDPRVVGIVLTGAGRGFCAGMDMKSLSATASGEGETAGGELPTLDIPPGNPEMRPDFDVAFGYLLTLRKPLIAAVNGPCAGLGLSLALLCDLRFASDRAVFTTSFSQRGLIAEHGQSWILPRLLGPSRALDILWSSRRVDANEAKELGLANRVIEHDRLLDEVRAYLEDLAAHASPTSLMVMKQQVYRHLLVPFRDAMQESDKLMGESLTRDDFREGVSSFVERRPPKFDRIRVD
jgi:enoyl-CoA hydratase/carnithine racemase